jgi:hypothetical protein
LGWSADLSAFCGTIAICRSINNFQFLMRVFLLIFLPDFISCKMHRFLSFLAIPQRHARIVSWAVEDSVAGFLVSPFQPPLLARLASLPVLRF